MTDEVSALLGAYHDGELDEQQMRRVEAYLLRCPDCRRELEALARLGMLVAADDAVPAGQVPERFVSQVMLRLERRPAQPAWRQALRLAWWSVPAVLVLGWALLQAVLITSGLLLTAIASGVGGDRLAALLPSGVGMGVPLASSVKPLAVLALLVVGLLAVGVLAYWSWLASWQVRARRSAR